MKRGMDAVFAKTEKRTPMMKRKPGLAVMIAVGKPKGPPPGRGARQDEEDDDEGMADAMDRPDPEILLAKIRMLTKRLDKLEAQMNGGMEGENESEDEDEDEDESEY